MSEGRASAWEEKEEGRFVGSGAYVGTS
jgi:hypothetical protein